MMKFGRLTLTSFAVEATQFCKSRTPRLFRLTLTSFAVEATGTNIGVVQMEMPPHAHFVRGGGDRFLRHLHLRLRPPHAHFVRGGGDINPLNGNLNVTAASRSLRSRWRRQNIGNRRCDFFDRLTLTSFAVEATVLAGSG